MTCSIKLIVNSDITIQRKHHCKMSSSLDQDQQIQNNSFLSHTSMGKGLSGHMIHQNWTFLAVISHCLVFPTNHSYIFLKYQVR